MTAEIQKKLTCLQLLNILLTQNRCNTQYEMYRLKLIVRYAHLLIKGKYTTNSGVRDTHATN